MKTAALGPLDLDTLLILAVIGTGLAVTVWVFAHSLATWLIRFRARRLPTALERLGEEWLAELDAVTSRPGKVRFGLGLLLTSTRNFVDAIGGPRAVPGNLVVSFNIRVYSDLPDRVVASAVDTCALVVGAGLFYACARVVSGLASENVYADSLLLFACFCLMTFLVHVYPVVRFGASPGKLLMKLRIVAIAAGELTYKHAVLRVAPGQALLALWTASTAVALASLDTFGFDSLTRAERSELLTATAPVLFMVSRAVTLTWWCANLCTYLATDHGRPLHDIIAGTVVVLHVPEVITAAEPVGPTPSTSIFR
jgi:uncharacterized RDD family membrane protein YckC